RRPVARRGTRRAEADLHRRAADGGHRHGEGQGGETGALPSQAARRRLHGLGRRRGARGARPRAGSEGGPRGPRRVRGRDARTEAMSETRGLTSRKGTPVTDGERSLAIFVDFENLALGFQNRRERFDIHRVLERLVEKGKIVAKKAYADWSRFQPYTAPLHEAAIELIEIPRRRPSAKTSAAI